MRCLRQVTTVHGNHKVSSDFGHMRYQYSLSDWDIVQFVLVGVQCLIRPIMMVVDGYWMRQIIGPFKVVSELEDDPETQSHIRFFTVNEFSFYNKRQQEGLNTPFPFDAQCS